MEGWGEGRREEGRVESGGGRGGGRERGHKGRKEKRQTENQEEMEMKATNIQRKLIKVKESASPPNKRSHLPSPSRVFHGQWSISA